MVLLQAAIGFGLLLEGLFFMLVFVAWPLLSALLFVKLKKKEVASENAKRPVAENISTALAAILLSMFILILFALLLFFVAGCFIKNIE